MSKRNFNTNTKNEETWLTPPYIVEALGEFDLDPCTQPENERVFNTAKKHYSLEDGDGLSLPWNGRVWLNPPYGKKTFEWLEKLSYHNEGGIALIFSRTETKGFHTQVWEKAHSVFFFEGRIKFGNKQGEFKNTANAPSCLVSYNSRDTFIIERSVYSNKLKGKIVFL